MGWIYGADAIVMEEDDVHEISSRRHEAHRCCHGT